MLQVVELVEDVLPPGGLASGRGRGVLFRFMFALLRCRRSAVLVFVRSLVKIPSLIAMVRTPTFLFLAFTVGGLVLIVVRFCEFRIIVVTRFLR